MFETLKRLFDAGKAKKPTLQKAVDRGWITEEQKQQILGL